MEQITIENERKDLYLDGKNVFSITNKKLGVEQHHRISLVRILPATSQLLVATDNGCCGTGRVFLITLGDEQVTPLPVGTFSFPIQDVFLLSEDAVIAVGMGCQSGLAITGKTKQTDLMSPKLVSGLRAPYSNNYGGASCCFIIDEDALGREQSLYFVLKTQKRSFGSSRPVNKPALLSDSSDIDIDCGEKYRITLDFALKELGVDMGEFHEINSESTLL